MKYSVCIDCLYAGRPLRETFTELASYGLDTIEFWSWNNKDLDELEALVKEFGFTVSCFCTDAFILNDPAQHGAFLAGLERSIPVAKRLGVTKLITQVGMALPDVPHVDQLFAIATGLKKAAPLLEANGITLMIEPLNLLVDHKGYTLAQSDEAAALLRCVDSPNVKMLFDIYHQQITEGYIVSNIQRFIDLIAHFHTAGSARREELSKGELNYQYVFDRIAETGYDGYIGLEYRPTLPDKGFASLPKLR